VNHNAVVKVLEVVDRILPSAGKRCVEDDHPTVGRPIVHEFGGVLIWKSYAGRPGRCRKVLFPSTISPATAMPPTFTD
jgi:hypothetical protein